MKKLIHTLIALGPPLRCRAFVATPSRRPRSSSSTSPRLYDSHYETEEQNAKLRGDEQKAQEEIERMNKEGNVLVDQYKELSEQSKNPPLTTDARAKAQADAQKKMRGDPGRCRTK